VIAFNQTAQVMKSGDLPKPEIEIEAAIRHYLDLRYNWTPATIGKQIKLAENFIQSKQEKQYETSTGNVVKFSTEKQVSQRIFPNAIEINLAKGTAKISGDRMSIFQGLRAAGELKITLEFEMGTRSIENPWGIYITKESEGQ
jgi:hypothetical protein